VPFYSLKTFAVPPRTYTREVILPLSFVAAATFGAALGLRWLLRDLSVPFVTLSVGGGLTALVGALAAFFAVLDRSERAWARQLVGRLAAPRGA
jgi:hydrogenase/urease accessory protein HupE